MHKKDVLPTILSTEFVVGNNRFLHWTPHTPVFTVISLSMFLSIWKKAAPGWDFLWHILM